MSGFSGPAASITASVSRAARDQLYFDSAAGAAARIRWRAASSNNIDRARASSRQIADGHVDRGVAAALPGNFGVEQHGWDPCRKRFERRQPRPSYSDKNAKARAPA